jgi:hypothetical protein
MKPLVLQLPFFVSLSFQWLDAAVYMKDRQLSIYVEVVSVHWSTFKRTEAIGVKCL